MSATVAVVCALTGMRGVGKTQVAAAYARSWMEAGRGLVGWVNAETLDVAVADLARIAEAVGVADPDGDSRNPRSGCASIWRPVRGERCWCSTTPPTPTRLRELSAAAGADPGGDHHHRHRVHRIR